MKALDIFGRVIAFHPALVDLTGSVTSALMLSQAIYWTKITDDPDGWFWKTAEEWTEETGLSQREQTGARKKLRSVDVDGGPIWYEDLRGLPAKLYYRLDVDLLDAWTDARNKYEQKRDTGMDNSAKQDVTKARTILYTKSTSKNTSETAPKNPQSAGSLDFEDAVFQLIQENYVTFFSGIRDHSQIDRKCEPYVTMASTYGWEIFVRAFMAAKADEYRTATKPEHVEHFIHAKPEAKDETAGDIIDRMTDEDYVPSDDVLASMNMIAGAMKPR